MFERALVLLSACAVITGAASAQSIKVVADEAHDKVASLSVDNADVKDAIGKLCDSFHKPYTFAAYVHGKVTVDIHSASFQRALISLLAAGAISYEHIDGVYRFAATKRTAHGAGSYNAPLPHLDMRLRKLDLEQSDIRDSLRDLFRACETTYMVAPQVRGSVTLQVEDMSAEDALNAICKLVGATWKVEDNVVVSAKPK